MKVNFNGMRKVATSDMNRLHSVLDELLSKYSDTLSPYEQEAIIEAYNRAAQSVEITNAGEGEAVSDSPAFELKAW